MIDFFVSESADIFRQLLLYSLSGMYMPSMWWEWWHFVGCHRILSHRIV